MIRGKIINFDIDSSIVEKKSNVVYMQYFHEGERGRGKKGYIFFSFCLGRL
jgi:hypothetical protein